MGHFSKKKKIAPSLKKNKKAIKYPDVTNFHMTSLR